MAEKVGSDGQQGNRKISVIVVFYRFSRGVCTVVL